MHVSGIRPTTTVLQGFDGAFTSEVGEIGLGITIDGVALNIEAIMVVCGLSNVYHLLGQFVVNSNIVLVVQNCVVTLCLPEDLSNMITLGDEDLKGNVPKRHPMREEADIAIELGTFTKVSVMVVCIKANRMQLVTA